MKLLKITLAATALALLITPVHAATLIDFADLPLTQLDFSQNFTLRKFDSSLGTLTNITLTVRADINATATATNPNSTIRRVRTLGAEVVVNVKGPETDAADLDDITAQATVRASQNFGTPGLQVDQGSPLIVTGLTNSVSQISSVAPSDFNFYIGTGGQTLTLNAFADSASAFGSGTTGMQYSADGSAGGRVTIEYTYTPSAAVVAPEPGSLALLLTGMGGSVGIVARRKKLAR